MPRRARIKAQEYIYHIMCRSISEFNLFRDDDDKNYYLDVLRKYCGKFHCAVLAYCLLDNHLHLHLDPQGYDVSKFMHSVNLSYSVYYNIKYRRRGPVFQDRFKSKVVSTDKYNLAVSAYIHNNPKDIEGYRGREYEYPFSSMGIYIGLRKDHRGLIDTGFILSLFNAPDYKASVQRYAEFVEDQKDGATDGSIERCLARFAVNEYRSERKIILRDIKPEKVVGILSDKLGVAIKECVMMKSRRDLGGFRAFTAFILRVLSGFSYREICEFIGNVSLSGVSDLCRRGYDLLLEGGVYRNIFDELVA